MVKKYHRPGPRAWSKIRPAVRQMRTEPTEAENVLWQRLRGHQLDGYKFRRQHPIGPYIVDFYCDQAALIIEVDGEIHREQVAEDQERQTYLEELGCRVIRFTNDQVVHQTDLVLSRIALLLTPVKI